MRPEPWSVLFIAVCAVPSTVFDILKLLNNYLLKKRLVISLAHNRDKDDFLEIDEKLFEIVHVLWNILEPWLLNKACEMIV